MIDYWVTAGSARRGPAEGIGPILAKYWRRIGSETFKPKIVGGRSPFFACLPLPVSLSVVPLPFPCLPRLRSRPLKSSRCLSKLPHGPHPKSNLVHFSFKIWHLVATIFMIFLKINLTNFVQFKRYIEANRNRALFCSKQDFSLITIVNINSLHIDTYMLKKSRVKFDHWTVVCCLSVLCKLFRQRHRNSEFRNRIGLLGLEFRLIVYFWHGLNRVCIEHYEVSVAYHFERNLSGKFSPLTAPFPFHDAPLLAPLQLHRFSPARSPLRSHSLNFRPAPLCFPLRSRSARMLCL